MLMWQVSSKKAKRMLAVTMVTANLQLKKKQPERKICNHKDYRQEPSDNAIVQYGVRFASRGVAVF